MLQWLSRRLLTSAVTLFGVITITFVLARIVPSNPAAVYIGPLARPAEIARVTKQLGLDRPLPVQYATYMRNLFEGDWGTSLATKEPVLGGIATRLPATLELIVSAMALAIALGIPLGVVAARHRGRAPDGLVRIGSVFGISMPVFWLGLLLQALFSGKLGLLPATSRLSLETSVLNPIPHVTGFAIFDALVGGDWAGLGDAARHLILPALTLAAYPVGLVARMTRASMLDVLGQDYVRTARTFGLGERRILWQLALRNAFPPTLTVIGLSSAYLLTGTFFVELVYDWPGIGQFATNALLNLDYPVIMGITLFGAIGFLSINLLVDVLQARLDPRVRLT
ncbi:MAG TPA: ABC transporter permease [Gaiellaceae bacterium]|nr:ABC transporter permease [Gaiellaceae bacterium]